MVNKEKLNYILSWVIKIAAILVFVTQCAQFYTRFALDVRQVLPTDKTVLINILRWFTMVASGVCIISPWFGNKYTKAMSLILGFVVPIMNFIFFKENMIAWGMGSTEFTWDIGYAYSTPRVVCWCIENALMIVVAIISGYEFIIKKEYIKFKPHYFIFILAGFFATFFYCYLPQNLATALHYKLSTEKPLDFSTIHIIYLLMNPILIIALFVIFRNKSEKDKQLMLVVMSLSSLYNFFYVPFWYGGSSFSWDSIPIHLCNAATILLCIVYMFKVKSVFYFTLFANVLGTVFAMFMPNIETAAFTYDTLRFWFNHIYAFILPIVGLSLGVFERPKLKNALYAILVFTGYFLVAAFMNALVSNWYPEISYFFMNDDFFLEKLADLTSNKLTVAQLHQFFFVDNKISFKIGSLTFNFYPALHGIIFGTFVVLMFVVWYIYDLFFHTADAHSALHIRKKIVNKEHADLRKLLNGRSLKEPLFEEAKGMIEIKHFTKVYSGSDKPSVEDLNLTIKDGEVYGFLGHNGAGKSTTIKSIVGIQTITDGQILVDGYDVAKQPVEAKLRIGYVSDNHAVYEKLTGREYINYIADLYMVNQQDRDARIEKYVKMFKLEDAIDREIKSYSHGMKQKIVVISSLIHDPKVWILDEPLTGLDPTSAFQIKECMREHASRGNIVFFSSHVIEVVEKICTKICIIGHGKLMCEYSLKDLKKKGISLEELYLKYVSSQERIN